MGYHSPYSKMSLTEPQGPGDGWCQVAHIMPAHGQSQVAQVMPAHGQPCNTPGVDHQLSSEFKLKHDKLVEMTMPKPNLWK
jgi:hypothetical protein